MCGAFNHKTLFYNERGFKAEMMYDVQLLQLKDRNCTNKTRIYENKNCSLCVWCVSLLDTISQSVQIRHEFMKIKSAAFVCGMCHYQTLFHNERGFTPEMIQLQRDIILRIAMGNQHKESVRMMKKKRLAYAMSSFTPH